jgi:hypothetical protein
MNSSPIVIIYSSARSGTILPNHAPYIHIHAPFRRVVQVGLNAMLAVYAHITITLSVLLKRLLRIKAMDFASSCQRMPDR